MTIIGIAIVIGVQSTDNIFAKFDAQDSASLQTSILKDIPYLLAGKNKSRLYTELALTMLCPVLQPCPGQNTSVTQPPLSIDSLPADPAWTFACSVPQKVTGSFGTVCMEDTLNAATFTVQLASWNNSRGTLYFFAIVLTAFAMIMAYLVHRQKNPQMMPMNTSHSGAYPISPPISVYGTPFYEMFRVGWGITSFIIVFWIANLLTSYKQFGDFYLANTSGSLQSFWADYDKKFIASVVCVGIYLCWPLVHFGIEVGLWVAFILPWYLLRSMCKPGLENMRYDVPLESQPGWVRLDMFFTEFSDIKRLGFSARAWEFMTGTKDAFCNCCETGMPVQTQQLPPWGQNTSNTSFQQPQNPNQMQQASAPPVASTPIASRNAPPASTQHSHDQFQMRTVPPTVANSSGSFQVQDSFIASSAVRASGTISEGEDKKEKKEKKHKKDKSDKGTKEKRDKSEKKEKKSKKDKSSKERGHDSD